MIYALAGIISALFLVADQITKAYAVENFPGFGGAPFIEGFISFQYISNDGGAWGLMEGHTWLLLSLTVLIMIVCIAMLVKNGLKNKLLFISICFIISGGLGNMIDRIFRDGKVIDFIKLEFIDFPIFNIADCAVCIGAGILIVYFILDIIKERKAVKTVATEISELPTEKGTKE